MKKTTLCFNIGAHLWTQVKFKKGWTMQAYGSSWNTEVQLQGKRSGMFTHTFVLRKEFNNKKGSLGFAGENFLMRAARVKTYMGGCSIMPFIKIYCTFAAIPIN
jgi:Outer membrane protein beta-barrel family